LLRELDDPFLSDLVGRTADIVAWASALAEGKPDEEDVARFLAGSTLNALQQNDVGRAAELLARARGADAATSALYAAVSKRLATPESLQLLATALETESQKGDQGALAARGASFLAALDRSALASVATVYPTLAKPEVRGAFRAFLESRAGDEPEAIATLARSEKPETQGEALRMLAKGGKGTKGWELLEATARDPKHPAAGPAQDLIDELTGARQRRELVKTLDAAPGKSER